MSAFIVSREHIRYLVWAKYSYAVAMKSAPPSLEEMESDALMLYNANIQSVNHRYEEHQELETEFNLGSPLTVEAAQVLKAIHCLNYQACEPPDWEESPAYGWLRDLAYCWEGLVPGYEEAKWEIPERPEPAQVRRLI